MYSWSKDWPTLTELFFGKGNGPQGKMVDTGKYPNGMTAKKPVAKKKKLDDQVNQQAQDEIAASTGKEI
jgi:hypothetical protein